MTFIWPAMLLLLLAMPLLISLYVRLQQRRRRLAANAGSLGLVRQAARSQFGVRRHIPPAFILAGLTILTVALARPQTVVSLPKVEGTVILAFDVSGSMAGSDIAPTRMEAAKAAARNFVQRQPITVQVGIVAFAESGFSVQAPTNDQAALDATINRLTPTLGTSLANGMLASLTLIEVSENDVDNRYYTNLAPTAIPEPTPMPPGVYTPAVIVLVTDGENTVSPDPLEAAQVAADRGVRVHTVGVGSPEGSTLNIEGFSVHSRLDEATLKNISQLTGGTYFNAQTEQDLRAIYDNLGSQVVIKPEETEVTALFAGVGIVLLFIGGVLSLLWFSRLP